ncbi:hypothetical protein GCM10022256_10100 [Frondihabitans peucedani]|uniref:Uncharacterized protein n=1 Tax=Frondihabitans peucedani TaxID=598626 RepID=A0ABP8DZN1_9MICO
MSEADFMVAQSESLPMTRATRGDGVEEDDAADDGAVVGADDEGAEVTGAPAGTADSSGSGSTQSG